MPVDAAGGDVVPAAFFAGRRGRPPLRFYANTFAGGPEALPYFSILIFLREVEDALPYIAYWNFLSDVEEGLYIGHAVNNIIIQYFLLGTSRHRPLRFYATLLLRDVEGAVPYISEDTSLL